MKTAARKSENVLGKDLRVGDVVIRGGYEWVIDRIAFEPDFPRYVCTCHWPGGRSRSMRQTAWPRAGGRP